MGYLSLYDGQLEYTVAAKVSGVSYRFHRLYLPSSKERRQDSSEQCLWEEDQKPREKKRCVSMVMESSDDARVCKNVYIG
ncbi:hypothetical protein ACTXT7_011698 [Hymenolepis weldensis]